MEDSVFNDFQLRAKSYEKLSRWITNDEINTTAAKLVGKCSDLIDVGCGTGYLSYFLNDIHPIPSVTLLDLSPNMLEIAKERMPGAIVVNDTLENYALKSSKRYETVIMRQVLHYVDDPVIAMLSVKRLLDSHGKVYIGQFTVKDEASNNWHERLIKLISVNKKRSFTLHKLCDLCSAFRICRIESTDYEENLKDYYARRTSCNSYDLIYNELVSSLNNEIKNNCKVRIEDNNLYFTVQFTHLLLQ